VTNAIEEAAHLGQQILILGRAPHIQAEIIPNLCFGQADFTESREYRELTRLLRERMAEAL